MSATRSSSVMNTHTVTSAKSGVRRTAVSGFPAASTAVTDTAPAGAVPLVGHYGPGVRGARELLRAAREADGAGFDAGDHDLQGAIDVDVGPGVPLDTDPGGGGALRELPLDGVGPVQVRR